MVNLNKRSHRKGESQPAEVSAKLADSWAWRVKRQKNVHKKEPGLWSRTV